MDGANIVRRPPFGNNPSVGQRGSDTRQRILEAALDVFADVGFHDARVELITKRAGCSRPAFYQYFSSKDDVFWRLAARLGHVMVELGEQLGPVTADTAGVIHLTDWLHDFAELYDEYAPVFTSFQAAAREDEVVGKESGSIRDHVGAALRRGFGEHAETDDTVAAAIVTMLIRCNFYRATVSGVGARRRSIEAVAELVHRLFAGPIPGVNMRPSEGARSRPVRRRRTAAKPSSGSEQRALRPRGESTRQRLLRAGAAVLPARGYHEARVDDIVAEAGVSHGSFYRYFESKDDLFRVMAEQAGVQMLELIDAFPADDDPTALDTWLTQWMTSYRSHGGVISTWQEMQWSDAALDAFAQGLAVTVLDRLAAILDGRGFGDPEADAPALLALLERLPYSVVTLHYAKEAEALDAMHVILRRGFMGIDAG